MRFEPIPARAICGRWIFTLTNTSRSLVWCFGIYSFSPGRLPPSPPQAGRRPHRPQSAAAPRPAAAPTRAAALIARMPAAALIVPTPAVAPLHPALRLQAPEQDAHAMHPLQPPQKSTCSSCGYPAARIRKCKIPDYLGSSSSCDLPAVARCDVWLCMCETVFA
jgi:hypothetical protein